jgi:hypothetical protein
MWCHDYQVGILLVLDQTRLVSQLSMLKIETLYASSYTLSRTLTKDHPELSLPLHNSSSKYTINLSFFSLSYLKRIAKYRSCRAQRRLGNCLSLFLGYRESRRRDPFIIFPE